MNISILQCLDGAKKAKGLAVIIDVFRAFTVEPYLFARNAKEVYAVGDKDIAYRMKELNPDVILVGERNGITLPGFDYGNSPSRVDRDDFTDKIVYHTTSAGTQGIANSINASEVITGSFANSKAISKYILDSGYEEVSLVCMGLNAERETAEDTLCAEYIRSLLLGEELDISDRLMELSKTSGKKFFDPAKEEIFPRADFDYCINANIFDFVIRATKVDESVYLMSKIEV